MRFARPAVLVILGMLFLNATATAASRVTDLSPSRITTFSGEWYMRVQAYSPAYTNTYVSFDGPAGRFVVHVNAWNTSAVWTWVPLEVTYVPGMYEVRVLAEGEAPSEPGYFEVVADAPVINAPSRIDVEATGPDGAKVAFNVTAMSPHDPNPSLFCTHASGNIFPVGATVVTCVAEDSLGNTSSYSFPVIVDDNKPPVLVVPPDMTVGATSKDGAQVHFHVSSNDSVDVHVPVTCQPHSGATFPVGTTQVLCSATDMHGNTGTGSFQVTVTLNQSTPALTIPTVVNAEATSAAGARVMFSATASDPYDGPLAVNCTPASGAQFALGATVVECSATNTRGTRVSGTFEVHVADTTPPVLNLPPNIKATATSNEGANVTYEVTASDAVDATVTLDCAPPSGSRFALGTTTVKCTAKDDFDNLAAGELTVTVERSQSGGPQLILPADMTVEATGPDGVIVNYAVRTDEGAQIDCAPAAGTRFPIGSTTVTCTATNNSGSTSGSFKVTVADKAGPVVTLPADMTVEAPNELGTVVYFTVTAHDAVDGERPVICKPASGSHFAVGLHQVACAASDLNGNPSGGYFYINVVTRPADARLYLPSDLIVDATSSEGAIVSYSVSASNGYSVTCAPASGSMFPIGTTTVHCNGTKSGDPNGRVLTGSFRVTVRDTAPPRIISINANPNYLWPANHQLVDVIFSVQASDHSKTVAKVAGVAVNEAADGPDSPDYDWKITGPLTLQLRAERDPHGTKIRVYTIRIEVTDADGNKSSATMEIPVDKTGKPYQNTSTRKR